MKKRSILSGVVIGSLGSAVLFGSGFLLYGWDPGDSPGYELSNGMNALIGPVSILACGAVLLLLLRHPLSASVVSTGVLTVPIFVAVFVEMARDSSTHNLFPFELLLYISGSMALHFPALLVASYYAFHPEPEEAEPQ